MSSASAASPSPARGWADWLFMDDHLSYAMVLVALAGLGVGATLGLGRTWEQLSVVQRHRWLR